MARKCRKRRPSSSSSLHLDPVRRQQWRKTGTARAGAASGCALPVEPGSSAPGSSGSCSRHATPSTLPCGASGTRGKRGCCGGSSPAPRRRSGWFCSRPTSMTPPASRRLSPAASSSSSSPPPFAHEAAASKYKTSAEATVDAVRVILQLCAESKTVKRVIHTASVSAASPLTKSSTTASAVYRDFISESCWTPLDVDYPLRHAHFDKYIESKLLSEKELLSYNDGESPAFEVVTLPLGLVAGDTILSHLPETIESAVAPVTKQEPYFMLPRIAQRLLGSVSLVHVDDACAALVFCMEQPSISGRFLCSAAYPTIHDILGHYGSKYPHLDLLREADEVARVQPERNKLGELGFRYKYGVKEILDESIDCAVRLGCLDASKLMVQQE